MTIYTRPELWKPRGIDDLEPNAREALRHPGSTCVVAGPGAGKTEFLAQRAVYLLATGTCPDPHRILAISFKTDAAENLGRRVRQRCGPDLAHRFSSLTFDKFTKGLVDRFISSIPAGWRPSKNYEVAFPKPRDVEDSLDSARNAARPEWRADVAALSPKTFEARQVGLYRLPPTRTEPTSAVEFAIHRWWDEFLKKGGSGLSFIAINRLAELLLRASVRLQRALRATYPFVFVDEFQDTTYAQYDFLLSAFRHDGIIATAVGDDKQRIMVWAGARTDAFARFASDFSARRIALVCNFRSSPDLVRIQHVVAQALDPSTPPPVSMAAPAISGDVAQVWRATTQLAEARHLATWISTDMATRGTAPRDYALLVRQKADDFEAFLTPAMSATGLKIRNESRTLGRTTLQDLLADDLCRAALALVRLGAQRRAPASWSLVSSFLETVRAIDTDDPLACTRTEQELSSFLTWVRAELAASTPRLDTARQVSSRVFSFFDLEQVARAIPEYRTGDIRDIIVQAFGLHLEACAQKASNWQECVDLFEGIQSIPLMTVHKSKGLEYDTVLFVGLDDQAWWSYKPGDMEGLATFFVALSRAKQRAIFTFCQGRGRRLKVADLYQLLTAAGVPEIPI